jgi:hypothetical protein
VYGFADEFCPIQGYTRPPDPVPARSICLGTPPVESIGRNENHESDEPQGSEDAPATALVGLAVTAVNAPEKPIDDAAAAPLLIGATETDGKRGRRRRSGKEGREAQEAPQRRRSYSLSKPHERIIAYRHTRCSCSL